MDRVTVKDTYELLAEVGFPVPREGLLALTVRELNCVHKWAFEFFQWQMEDRRQMPPTSRLPASIQRHFPPHCRVCGCTENRACFDEHLGPCHWVESDLCSSCAVERVGGVPV